MNSSTQNFLSKIEIAWSLVWTFFLICFYLYLGLGALLVINFEIINIILIQYVLQIIFVIAALVSLVIFFSKHLSKQPNIESSNDLLAEGGRLVFPILNLVFYILEFFELPIIKTNFSFLWLILPWLLWLPIIIDLSTQVKQEFSWIK